MKTLFALIVVAMLAAGACGGASAAPGPITVTMSEWSMRLSQTSVPAGEVTFVVRNDGKITHEIAILKTDLAHDRIPLRPEDATKVQEPGDIGEIEDVEAGTTKQDTFTLVPGNYVIICNEAAHYAAGMHVALVVR